MEETIHINLADWYSADAAAKRLSQNSGKDIQPAYARKLAQYGKVRTVKFTARGVLYNKADVDAYVVEDRGGKSAKARRAAVEPNPENPVA